MSKFTKYWLWVLLTTIGISAYPIYMGFRVIYDMVTAGAVTEYDFPKYIIPYTPIAIAVIVAVALMPMILKFVKKAPTLTASVFASGVFFGAELLFENKIIVTTTVKTTLESWQMAMCYVQPELYETRQWTAVDILMGEYSPTFKLHFYLISVVVILGILNSLYGFGKMLCTGDRSRCKALILQSVSVALFLGLCIVACFTAFFRDGELTVSPVSALLMGTFFVVLGVTVGCFAASFTLGKANGLSSWMPAGLAVAVTLAMYVGEMFLLSGNLYRLGTGFLFRPIPGIVLAPVDVGIIFLSGTVTFILCRILNRRGCQRL